MVHCQYSDKEAQNAFPGSGCKGLDAVKRQGMRQLAGLLVAHIFLILIYC